MRNTEEIFEIYLEMLAKIHLLLRLIHNKKRMGADFINYKNSLDFLRNIQKSILLFYESTKNQKMNFKSSKHLNSLKKILNELRDIISNKNVKSNILRILEEIDALKEEIKTQTSYGKLELLNRDIVVEIESFCKSLRHLDNI